MHNKQNKILDNQIKYGGFGTDPGNLVYIKKKWNFPLELKLSKYCNIRKQHF